MILFRLILLFTIGFLVYRIYRIVTGPRVSEETPRKLAGEQMVKCAFCDVHVPQADAVRDEDRWYCCEEHMKRHREARGGN